MKLFRRFPWLTSRGRSRRRRLGIFRSRKRFLHCEPLETRRLLAITVDTLVDEADGSIVDGDVSLRDAIATASAGEMIDFDASLDGGTILLTLGELAVTDAPHDRRDGIGRGFDH